MKTYRPSLLNSIPSLATGAAIVFLGYTVMQMAEVAGTAFGFPRVTLFGTWMLRLSIAYAAIQLTLSILDTLTTEYAATAERIEVTTGIFTRRRGLVELFRIKDLEVIQPAYLRPFKAGHLLVASSDKLSPLLLLRAIKDVDAMADWLKSAVAMERRSKGVRELD